MTLRTGSNRNRRSSDAPPDSVLGVCDRQPGGASRAAALTRGWQTSRRAGFTLIELILVMAMLLTVIAVSIPSLSNFFRGRTLDSEARRFLSLTRYGQSRAVSEGVPMKLWIDTKEGSYGLEQEQSSTDGDPKAVSFDLDDDLSLELTILPSRSSVLAPTGQPGEPRRTVPTIRFQPDGFISETSPQGVWIRERAGARKDNVIGIALSRNRLNYEIQTNALQNPAR